MPRLRRTSRIADLKIAASLVAAAFDRDRPLIANLIITRRCNLSCGYCFEYDKVSQPVPLDVLKERLNVEYGLPVDFEMARFSVCRWITADSPAELTRFIETHRGDIARDLDDDPVFLAPHEFGLNYEAERWKDIRFAAVKDYQVRDAA